MSKALPLLIAASVVFASFRVVPAAGPNPSSKAQAARGKTAATSGDVRRAPVARAPVPAAGAKVLLTAAPGGADDEGLAPDDDASLLESKEVEYAVMSGIIEREVETVIKAARMHMAESPLEYKQDLKLLLDRVRKAPELTSDKRQQLRTELERILHEVDRRAIEKEAADVANSKRIAEGMETERFIEALETQQEKEKQLMDRFNSLMDEGRYLEAEEGPAAEVSAIDPHSPVGVAATLSSRRIRYVQQNLDYRVRRQKGVVDTLATVEIALIPFPDDQPIVYPDAQFWQELSLRRKKYAAVDLKIETPAEKKIKKALSDSTTLEFVETPLNDVIDYLKDLHEIAIQIDVKALEDAGSGTDTPISINLRGITLKSALRLMLQPLDLAYVIKDEVLLITTKERADTELVTKVYPVADLVLPIQAPMMGRMGGRM